MFVGDKQAVLALTQFAASFFEVFRPLIGMLPILIQDK
jgi:hypothetical protein